MLPDIEEDEKEDESKSRISEGLLASGMFKQDTYSHEGLAGEEFMQTTFERQ